MNSVENFGTVTNLVLSASVALYGFLVWLRDKTLGAKHPFRILAYRCWWASWVCWVFAWAVLLLAAMRSSEPVPLNLRIVTLIFDNLNSVFLILVYFVITRGDHFNRSRINTAFMQISGSLTLGCAILYLLAPLLGLNFAYEVHRTWSLCLGVFAPMMVGWACRLRYNTLLVLIIGFAYGFMQPLVYATQLETAQSAAVHGFVQFYKPVIAMTLGGLKVLWAVAFMQVLAHGSISGESLVASKTAIRFHFFRHWEKKVLGHTLVLSIAYCCLLIALVSIYAQALSALATALGIVSAFMALLDWFWKLWHKGSQHQLSTQPKSDKTGRTD
jgi:hypothetical protein